MYPEVSGETSQVSIRCGWISFQITAIAKEMSWIISVGSVQTIEPTRLKIPRNLTERITLLFANLIA